MKVTAKMEKSTSKGKIKAYGSINIEESFVVYGVKVIEGSNGLFVAMPNKKNLQGEYKDICFPVTKEARDQITEAVLKAYNSTEQNNSPNNDFVSVDEDFDNSCPF